MKAMLDQRLGVQTLCFAPGVLPCGIAMLRCGVTATCLPEVSAAHGRHGSLLVVAAHSVVSEFLQQD